MSASRKGEFEVGEVCEGRRGSRDAVLRREMSAGTANFDAQREVESHDVLMRGGEEMRWGWIDGWQGSFGLEIRGSLRTWRVTLLHCCNTSP